MREGITEFKTNARDDIKPEMGGGGWGIKMQKEEYECMCIEMGDLKKRMMR